MVNCPVCGKEHKNWSNMATHMILIAINHSGEEHETYLSLLTNKDQHYWGHKNDAVIGDLMRRVCKKYGRLPRVEELEELSNPTQGPEQ